MSQENTAKVDEKTTNNEQAVPVELTVQDLGVLRSIIDVASQRGAFKANEMEAVGKTYNKLDVFLQQVAKAEEAKKEEETANKGDK